jgi:uncharacterized protein YfiM (DUF2279 family)
MNSCVVIFFTALSLGAAEDHFPVNGDTTSRRLQVNEEMLSVLKRTNDPWFSEDKFYHLSVSTALSVLSFHIYDHFESGDRARAKIYSVSTTACIGLCKELYDKKTKNHFSWKDLFWDGIGLALGCFLFIE